LALESPQLGLAVVLNGKILGPASIRAFAKGGEIDVDVAGPRQAQMLARRIQSRLDGNASQSQDDL
jgi:hypothetical protein